MRRIESLREHVEAVAWRAQHKAGELVGRLIELGQRRSNAALFDDSTRQRHQIVESGAGACQCVDEKVAVIVRAVRIVALDDQVVLDDAVVTRREIKLWRDVVGNDHVERGVGDVDRWDINASRRRPNRSSAGWYCFG